MFNFSLPTAIAAEQVALGSIITGVARITDLPKGVAGACADPIHAALWRLLATREAAGASNAAVPLGEALASTTVLEEVGGSHYVGQLVALAASDAAGAVQSADAIIEAWRRRQLIELDAWLVGVASSEAMPALEIVAEVDGTLGALANGGVA